MLAFFIHSQSLQPDGLFWSLVPDDLTTLLVTHACAASYKESKQGNNRVNLEALSCGELSAGTFFFVCCTVSRRTSPAVADPLCSRRHGLSSSSSAGELPHPPPPKLLPPASSSRPGGFAFSFRPLLPSHTQQEMIWLYVETGGRGRGKAGGAVVVGAVWRRRHFVSHKDQCVCECGEQPEENAARLCRRVLATLSCSGCLGQCSRRRGRR